MTGNLKIIEITKEMVREAAEIEKRSFSEPWTENMILGSIGKDYVYAIQGEKNFLGYLVFSITLDTAELLRIAVTPDNQNRGLGTKLMTRLIEDCNQRKVERIFLEVRNDNSSAISLYKKFGFETIGCRKGYYRTETGSVDAITMCKVM